MASSQPTEHRWHAVTGRHSLSGADATVPDAWRSAADAALRLAEDTAGASPLDLVVDDGEPAQVLAAQHPDGQIDRAATATLLARFLDVVTAEPPDTAERTPS